MKSQTRHPTIKAALVFAIILFAIHSFLTLCMFLYVYSQRGVAQAELAWAVFFLLDFPTPQLTFQWLGSTPPMRALFDWGYDLIGSGPNLRMFAMVALAGGFHWFLIGCALGACFSSVRTRLSSSHLA
jgi:hypothetical protein